MEENEKMVDQAPLAQSVSEKIPYTFTDMFLVKPLDPVKVKKEFTKPVAKDKPTVDENGVEATDYAETEVEVKEVDSDYRKGIVLKVPISYTKAFDNENTCLTPINVGDVVVFKDTTKYYFDLIKDTVMLSSYNIVAIEDGKH